MSGWFGIGGRGGIRTPDPGVANAVLSQLSYTPNNATAYNITNGEPRDHQAD